MAHDILAIPITAVASKATFSVGSLVIDSCRASLAPKTVLAFLFMEEIGVKIFMG